MLTRDKREERLIERQFLSVDPAGMTRDRALEIALHAIDNPTWEPFATLRPQNRILRRRRTG